MVNLHGGREAAYSRRVAPTLCTAEIAPHEWG